MNSVTEPRIELKNQVRTFWNAKACGEVYAKGSTFKQKLEAQAAQRYRLEPHIFRFADFSAASGKDVLEVGVGMGADHLNWARARPRSLSGIDLTERAINCTARRLDLYGFSSNLLVGDSEALPFPDDRFDIVYSYGVLHHSPDTARAVREVARVLRPGGVAKVMIYHAKSLVGYMLWLRYALLALRPDQTLANIYANHLESPGTRAFTIRQVVDMFSGYRSVHVQVVLSPGDLLNGAAGQRHRGLLLQTARIIYPRPLIRIALRNHGLFILISAIK